MRIERILATRSDLSTFLVHLSRNKDNVSAKARLKRILREGSVRAMSPFGHAVTALRRHKKPLDSQHAVCFTETPLQHVALLTRPIEGRAYRFGPYGIAITKAQARVRGVNPVWYLDITPGHEWLTNPLDALVEAALEKGRFLKSNIGKLTPYIEQMGTGATYRKEFWWEREWRKAGDLPLPRRFIVLCPEAEHAMFEKILRKTDHGEQPIIDPHWSLEEIIARLARFDADDVRRV